MDRMFCEVGSKECISAPFADKSKTSSSPPVITRTKSYCGNIEHTTVNLPSSELGLSAHDGKIKHGRSSDTIKTNDNFFNFLTSNSYLGLVFCSAVCADTVKNTAPAIYHKAVMLTYVMTQISPHKALKMLKMTAFKAFQVEMVAARSLVTEILINARALTLSLEFSYSAVLTKTRQISIY